ncbi:MAG: hypothetical protein Q8N08_07230, partial [Methanobacteriaceae archaeon]|nr:hypothetical protein [Methanobacteriaceae archaeon]
MKKKLIGFLLVLSLVLITLPALAAAQPSSLNDLKGSTDQALQNVSEATNQTAQEVQKTLDPIQDIL